MRAFLTPLVRLFPPAFRAQFAAEVVEHVERDYGIHALMAFTINQRRREIGVRAALGADAHRILTGVLSRAARQLGLGVALGLGVSLVLERWSDGRMMGGSPLVYVPVIAAFMAVVGALAAAGPARQGLRVQPTEALRGD